MCFTAAAAYVSAVGAVKEGGTGHILVDTCAGDITCTCMLHVPEYSRVYMGRLLTPIQEISMLVLRHSSGLVMRTWTKNEVHALGAHDKGRTLV